MIEHFTQKWVVISLLEDVEVGSEFHYSSFPLHITLAGVFAVNRTGKQLATGLPDLLIDQPPVLIQADQKAMYGPNHDIPVMKVKKTNELMNLYSKIFHWLEAAGVEYNSPEYQGVGYSPHVTNQKSGVLSPGEQRLLTSVSLVDMFPDSNGEQRKIYKTIELS